MKSLFALIRGDEHASAAAELALALPTLLILIVGPMEIGNYFMDEHALIKGVRDGAVYAAHQDISNYDCATNTIGGTVAADTKNLVRSGQLSGGTDRLPNWGSATFTMTLTCPVQASDGTTLSGIYKLNNGKVPVIRVTASLSYQGVLVNLGFRPTTMTLTASQEATVMGI